MEERFNNLKLAERGVHISMVAYIILSILKLSVGYLFHSKALTADGFNNTTDIIASLAILIGLRISRKPADENHLYGYFRSETIASLIASLIMVGVGVNVLYNATHSIIFFKAQAPDVTAAVAGVISGILIYVVYRYNKRTAIKINSSGLMAAAKGNLSDVWVSIGTSAGIIASQFGLPWIDPLAAIIVGIIIIKTGWGIFKEASHNLSDGFDKEKLENITECIKKVSEVKKLKKIRARVHGNNVFLDVIVIVSSDLSIIEGYNITKEIEETLRYEFSITEVIVQVQPEG